MEFSLEDSRLLNLWQKLNFGCDSSKVSVADRADSCRGVLAQIAFLRASGKIGIEEYRQLFCQHSYRYASVVDDQDENKGLNNFAAPIIALTSGHKNESQKWKSSLSMKSVENMECVKTLLDKAKERKSIENSPVLCVENSPPPILNNLGKPTNNHGQSILPNEPKETVTTESAKFKFRNTKQLSSNNSGTLDNTGRVIIPEVNKPESKQESTLPDFHLKPFVKNNSESLQGTCTETRPGLKPQGSSKSTTRQRPDVITSTKDPFHNLYQNCKDVSIKQTSQRQQSAVPWKHSSGYGKRKVPDTQGELERFVPPSKQPSYGVFNHQVPGSSKNTGTFPYHGQQRSNTNNQNRQRFTGGNDGVPSKRNNSSVGYRDYKQHSVEDEDERDSEPSPFLTAREQYIIDCKKKNQGGGGGNRHVSSSSYGTSKKSLGMRRGPNRRFVPPVLNRDGDEDSGSSKRVSHNGNQSPPSDNPEVDERLKHFDPKIVELIKSEIMDHGPPVSWDDIAGLEFAKKVIKEIVVWPMLRPDIFTGLRGPPKGMLLFGPPGTGKTLIGKCIASQSGATFFSISASSLTSKWVGEGEKMVRVLFAVARCQQPAVVFIDEIDSLLSQRSDGEHESSRRIKTEFLVQLDGAATSSEDRILIIGATNRPHEIDEAARRRLVKRLYIPLPEAHARCHIIRNLLAQQNYKLSEEELNMIVNSAEGYSGSDMSNLCREAALGPIRSISGADIQNISADEVRPIFYQDFEEAFTQVRASVSQKDLDLFVNWNKQYGSTGK